MNNDIFIQEVKRYLHQAEVNRDNTIDVCWADIDSKDPSRVLFCLFALESYGYLKVIGIKKGFEADENPYTINDFSDRKYPAYITVMLAEDFGQIDSKFELTYTENSGEAWINNIMLIKQFNTFYGKNRYQLVFEEAFHKPSELLDIRQFKVIDKLQVQRLDTAIKCSLDTLSAEALGYFFPVLKTKKLRFEPVFYDNEGRTDFFVKQPHRYELDPFQKGEWSEDCRRQKVKIFCLDKNH